MGTKAAFQWTHQHYWHSLPFARLNALQPSSQQPDTHSLSDPTARDSHNIVTESGSEQHQFDDFLRNADEVSVEFSGKYLLVVTNKTNESMRNNDDIYVTWNKDKKR